MTTIVFDGKYFVADTQSQLHFDNHHHKHGKPYCPKCKENIDSTVAFGCKVNVHPGAYFRGSKVIATAAAGYKSVGLFLISVMLHSDEPEEILKNLPNQVKKSETTAVILTEQHLHTVDIFGNIKKITELPFAIGSGSQAALLALNCGKTAASAIRMASTVDKYTNDEVMGVRVIQKDAYQITKIVTQEQLDNMPRIGD